MSSRIPTSFPLSTDIAAPNAAAPMTIRSNRGAVRPRSTITARWYAPAAHEARGGPRRDVLLAVASYDEQHGRERMTTAACSHLDQITITALPGQIDGCEECLKIGSRWVHL